MSGTPGSGEPDTSDAGPREPRHADPARPRKPSAANAPGVTALLFVFFTWEAASSSVSVWLRIVLALCAVPAFVDLVRIGVWRARTRART
ncbi:hypothetical protein [Streptomyces sp. R44]|uniref:Uncharacterized protein n=1 Tax=Streptomyces sp. R44 TaxID=3238633 RepID=A0AB39SXX6_9ACTN